MWALVLSTIVTSAADSVNPIAISQQFVLQAMVKKANHILFFIIAIAVTNFIGGLLAYFGLITPISRFFMWILGQYGQIIFTFELILGICFLVAVSHKLQSTKIAALKKLMPSSQSSNENDEQKSKTKIKSVSPLSLTLIGILATLSELTTALPYFAFLAILFQYQISALSVIGILILYNIIYSLPLIVLYIIYIKAREKFDCFYTFLKLKMEKLATIFVPIVLGMVGLTLILHSVTLLLKNYT